VIPFLYERIWRISLPITLLLLFVFGSASAGLAQQANMGVEWDQAMRIPSPEETSSWFPDLAVDREGRVHVIWCETDHVGAENADPRTPFLGESVHYSMWDGQQWSPANDIVPPQQFIIRNAIAVDSYDVLSLLFDFSPSSGYNLYHKQAQASDGFSAAAWTPPRLVNSSGNTYMSDIAIYQDTLHIVYDDQGAEEGDCPGCADIFYRHSTDRGLTWSAPINLSPSFTGSSRAQIELDDAGTVYVAWDEGWDRRTGIGDPLYGVYMYSRDGGSTWSIPTVISYPTVIDELAAGGDGQSEVVSPTVTTGELSAGSDEQSEVLYPNSANAQLSVGSDGQGGVMLVWRTTSRDYPGIYFMWSVDWGESWSVPQTLPSVIARNWTHPFDIYDMATDSAGHIHLLVVGYLSALQVAPSRDQGPPGLYHFEWDGSSWSRPTPVYAGDWYPHYPHLVVDRGNQLHATWFVRKDPWGGWDAEAYVPYQVWYAHGQSRAPAETPVVPPTLTPVPPTPTPLAMPTPTAVPTLDPSIAQSSMPPRMIESIYTETDEVIMLAKSLAPVALIIAAVVVGVRIRRR
jgi:hypothetical protein